MKKYIPLILVEAYLITTLLLFYFGPIDFKIHNHGLFITLILLYHAFFIWGYWLGAQFKVSPKPPTAPIYSNTTFALLFFVGLIGVLGTYNNLMLSETIIPYGFFDNLHAGLTEPGLVYTERMMSLEAGVSRGSRLFNVASIFFSFCKLLFIFYFLYFWNRLGPVRKAAAIVYSFLFISSGIASGTNSVIFIFFIFSSLSLLVALYVRRYAHITRVLVFCGIMFFLPISSFGYIMSQRGGGFEYFASTSTLGDISVASAGSITDNSSVFDFLYYSVVWLNYYLVQGYYGFSLILNLDHNWTFGFGNSAFLQRQLSMITGIDVSTITFQSRISEYWDESAQWHSFYGQFANDFGLAGLTIFMLLLGYFFSKVWISVIYKNSFYGAALIPIFVIMFVFMPANNQVFGYIDTLSYFIFVSIFWLLEGKKLKLRNGVQT